jgi:hypothetical protein
MDLWDDFFMATFETLLEKNKYYSDRFIDNPLMKLVQSPEMAKKEARERLLDCIQVFSDYFQKTVLLRNALCEDPKFSSVAQEHLHEEFEHNLSLMKDRKNRARKWDPIIESCACWFTYKMFTLDQEEKTLLMHLVLETSANSFFQEAHKVMQSYGETTYFKIHSEADEHHEKMGQDLLRGLPPSKYERLLEVQFQGWSMMETICGQIAQISKSGA